MHLSANKLAAFASAIAAPCLTLLVDQHALTPLLATDIGAVIFTAVAFLHINNDEARAAIAALQPATPTPAPVQPAPPVAPVADPVVAPDPVAPPVVPAPAAPSDLLAADPAVPSAL